jgi:hypothetical protein
MKIEKDQPPGSSMPKHESPLAAMGCMKTFDGWMTRFGDKEAPFLFPSQSTNKTNL